MATTLDAARLIEREGRYLMSGIHIGDGTALLDDGIRLRLLTTAHTLGARLSGQDNPASKHHPDRSRLLRALGMNKNADVDSWDERAMIGHRYVLSSDGLINALGMDRFGECLVQARGFDVQQVADLLVDAGLKEGRAKTLDNLTIVVADIINIPNHDIHD
jgi:protein phosphatase